MKPALSVKEKGSPLARLRDEVVRAAGWVRSEDAKVMARLIAGIHGDKNLERTYLERFIFPRRRMRLRLVEEAIACGELKRDTDPDLFIDSLYGPLFYRWLQGHAPVDKSFAEALANKIIEAFCTSKWRA